MFILSYFSFLTWNMERTQCQWWRSLPIAEWWYVHYILFKVVCYFHFVSAQKYLVAFMWWLILSKCVVMSWHVSHISQWDCFMPSWKKSHWRDCHTWNVGSNMNTYPGESSHLYHWCLLHWVSRGHPVSIPGGDCFPWVFIVFFYQICF